MESMDLNFSKIPLELFSKRGISYIASAVGFTVFR